MTKRPAETLWPTVSTAIVAGVVVAMHLGKVGPALPAIRLDLTADLTTIGWIASIVSLIGALGSLLLGTIANRVNARALAIGALVLLAFASFAGGAARTAIELLAARTFEGLAIITMAVSAPAIIARATSPKDRSFGLALWSTYVPIGMTFGILIAVLVLALGDWRSLWWSLGALTAAFAILFGWVTRHLPRNSPAATKSVGATIESVLTPGPWLLGACFACYAFMWVSLITWMPSFLFSELGLSLSQAALATAVMTGVNVIGNFAGAIWLRANRSRLMVIVLALTTMAVTGWLTLAASTDAEHRVVFGILFSLVSGVIPAALFGATSILARRPDEVASANGVVVQGSQCGQLAGPPVAGALAQASGSFSSTAIVFPIASIIGIGFGLAIARLEKQRDQ